MKPLPPCERDAPTMRMKVKEARWYDCGLFVHKTTELWWLCLKKKKMMASTSGTMTPRGHWDAEVVVWVTHTHKHVQLGSIQAYTNFCCLYALQSCWHALIIEIYAINVILHSDILPNKQLWKLSFLSLCPGHIFNTCTWFKYIWCYSSYHSSMQSFLSPLN